MMTEGYCQSYCLTECHTVQSGRSISGATSQNILLMFTAMTALPKFTTIADFSDDTVWSGKSFPAFLRNVVSPSVCLKMFLRNVSICLQARIPNNYRPEYVLKFYNIFNIISKHRITTEDHLLSISTCFDSQRFIVRNVLLIIFADLQKVCAGSFAHPKNV
jgi:hypothetical protein